MNKRGRKYVFAIDLGTSGPKTALVSTKGEIIDWEFEKTPLILLYDGGAEQDPNEWWSAIKSASKKLLGRQRHFFRDADIIAVSITSQWSGTVAVDKNGNPLMNAIIWMDSRGAPYVQDLTKGIVSFKGYGIRKLLKWLRLTGGIPAQSGKDSISHILYIKNEWPEIYEKTRTFLEPKDYLNLRLTGKYAASFDSIALHWLTDNRDISSIKYDKCLLKYAGIAREKLPDSLIKATDVLGSLLPETADELGLPSGIPVIGGTPDLQSATIGSGAVRDYEAHLYLGTSSWLICHVPFKKIDLLHNMTSLPSAIPNRYFIANDQECAGVCLTWLKSVFGFSSYSEIDEMAEQALPGNNGIIFTPWLYGERTPVENPLIRGGFHNLSLEVKREDIARAVLEGVAYNSRWLLECVEKFAKKKLEKITVIGGGANSNVWCQIYADVLNRQILQPERPQLANLRGAAFLALASLNYISFDDIPNLVKIRRVYEPNPVSREIYDELFREFIAIYRKNKKIYSRLNKVKRGDI